LFGVVIGGARHDLHGRKLAKAIGWRIVKSRLSGERNTQILPVEARPLTRQPIVSH
jgi:hypothetical protein